VDIIKNKLNAALIIAIYNKRKHKTMKGALVKQKLVIYHETKNIKQFIA